MRRHPFSFARRAMIGMACGTILAGLAGGALAQDGPPDATIEFSGGAVAAGVGYSWGSGTLTYQGQTYPLKITGLSVADIGASKYSASGEVYGLKSLADIEGAYASAELGATVAGGGSANAMKNDKGVHIKFTTTRAGLQFTIAPKGATIKLK
ncbi:MAG: hypothetical protein JWR84_828 [Caulobacter sp.]|nr:hypothetical protein [Caulobacter sp.]